jgi:hypothetical protein
VACVLAAYPPTSAARLAWLHAGISIVAIVVLSVGLALRRPALFFWSLALLGGNYALWLALGTHAIDQRAPIVGAGLLLTAELAFDSLEPEVGRPEATAVLARTIAVALTVLGGAGVGAVILAVSSIPLSGGVAVTALGAAAAVLALGLLMRLAAERR